MKPRRYRKETDEHYSKRCERVQRTEDIMNSINNLANSLIHILILGVVLFGVGSCAMLCGVPL